MKFHPFLCRGYVIYYNIPRVSRTTREALLSDPFITLPYEENIQYARLHYVTLTFLPALTFSPTKSEEDQRSVA